MLTYPWRKIVSELKEKRGRVRERVCVRKKENVREREREKEARKRIPSALKRGALVRENVSPRSH